MANGKYRVELTTRAQRDLRKLSHDLDNVLQHISALESDPHCGERLSGPLRDAWSLHFSLKGSGEYRAIYVVEDDCVCLVFLVAARENIYREAVKRFKSL